MSAHLAPHQFALTIEADTAALSEVRSQLRQWLTGHDEKPEDWLLIANELCTNSMAVTADPIQLVMTIGEFEAVLEVTDNGPGFELRVVDPGVASSRRRGLWIVEQLTDRLEVAVSDRATIVVAAKSIVRGNDSIG